MTDSKSDTFINLTHLSMVSGDSIFPSTHPLNLRNQESGWSTAETNYGIWRDETRFCGAKNWRYRTRTYTSLFDPFQPLTSIHLWMISRFWQLYQVCYLPIDSFSVPHKQPNGATAVPRSPKLSPWSDRGIKWRWSNSLGMDSNTPERYLIGGLKHALYFSRYIESSQCQLTFIFFRGGETTNQICVAKPCDVVF